MMRQGSVPRRWLRAGLAILLCLPALVRAQGELAPGDPAAALDMLDQAPPPAVEPPPRDWTLSATAGIGWRGAGHAPEQAYARLALDGTFQRQLRPDWHFSAASQLDVVHAHGEQHSINTLRELWLAWRVQPDLLLDMGRINVRHGQLLGYNPADFLRRFAVRSLISPDPEVLRHNRLGTVMLRGQYFVEQGAASLLYAPRLAQQRRAATLAPDWAATNDRQRLLASVARRWSPVWDSDVLLYWQEDERVQLASNHSVLASHASVLRFEWSGGGRRETLAEAAGQSAPWHWHNRLALGLDYTFAHGGTLSLEWQRDSAAPDATQWQQLRQWAPAQADALRLWALAAQELPTRQSAFVHYRCADAGWPGLEVQAMLRRDLADDSDLLWSELNYNRQRWQWAVQARVLRGEAGSVYGAAAQRRELEISVRYYF